MMWHISYIEVFLLKVWRGGGWTCQLWYWNECCMDIRHISVL